MAGWIERAKSRLVNWRGFLTHLTQVVGILSLILTMITVAFLVYDHVYAEAKVSGDVQKYRYKGVVAYGGTLINTSRVHADKLTLKASFGQGKVLGIDVETTDVIDRKGYGNPVSSVEFSLGRLSRDSKCFFDIIVDAPGEVTERIDISWGKEGKLTLTPRQADDETARAIQRGMKLQKGRDPSLDARQKWIENNSRNIRGRR